jgi:hypothetical protein
MMEAPRWLQQSGCNPVTLTNTTNGGVSTVVVPTTVASMEITFPPVYYTGVDMQDTGAVTTATKILTERLMLLLKNATKTEAAFSSFTQSWSSCTGLPPTTGVITNVASAATITTVQPSAPTPADDTFEIWPIVVGVLVFEIICGAVCINAAPCLVGVCCRWCCCGVRRRVRPEEEEAKPNRKPYNYAYPMTPPAKRRKDEEESNRKMKAAVVAADDVISPTACRIDAGFQ